MTEKTPHVPVMLNEVLIALNPVDGGCYVDGTFGAGGYTKAVLDSADCQVHGFDRDPAAIKAGETLAAKYPGRLHLHQALFGDMEAVLERAGVSEVDGVALDVGVSSMQLDQAERGFSFLNDGPLDMRMGSEGESAAEFVNGAPEAKIAQVLKEYGEERQARRIARAISVARKDTQFETTADLVRVVERVLGSADRHKLHPATRTFQAIRIYINSELEQLVRGLAAAEKLLRPAGRLVVVAFHSLEDRIVKRFFAQRSGGMGRPSRHVPLETDTSIDPSFETLSRRARVASDDEVAANPRARSAKMRSAIRTEASPWPLGLDELGLPKGVEL